MAILFEHTQINGLELPNRFIRSATWEGLADETGDCTPDLIERWQSGDLRKATCISCNGCFGPARAGRGILCVQDIQWKP